MKFLKVPLGLILYTWQFYKIVKYNKNSVCRHDEKFHYSKWLNNNKHECKLAKIYRWIRWLNSRLEIDLQYFWTSYCRFLNFLVFPQTLHMTFALVFLPSSLWVSYMKISIMVWKQVTFIHFKLPMPLSNAHKTTDIYLVNICRTQL